MRALLDRLGRLLPNGLASLASSSLISQVATLAAMPFLTRFCTLSDFGLFQIYATVLGVATLISCLRYDYALLQPQSARTASQLTILCCVTSAISGLLVLLAAPIVLHTVRTGGWAEAARLGPAFAAGVSVVGISNGLTQWLVRTGHFPLVARSRALQGVSTSGFQVIAALHGYGGAGLVIADLAGRLLGLLVLFAFARLDFEGEGSGAFSGLWATAREYRRFPLVSTPASLVNSAGGFLPVLILEHSFGTAGVGMYSMIDRVLGMPTLFLGQAVSQTFMHRFRDAMAKGRDRARGELRHSAKLAAGLGAVAFIAVAVGGGWLFSFVLGDRWHATGVLAQALAIPYFITYVFWPVMPTLILLDHLRVQMAWEVARAAAFVGLAGVAGYGILTLEPTIGAITLVTTGFGLVHYGLCERYTARLPQAAAA